jgi:3-hydroxyisobutyrate dehydrogenase-like beta-hydroxyacid dehydrogenase
VSSSAIAPKTDSANRVHWFRYAAPQQFYPLAGKMLPWLWATTIVLTLAGLWVGLVMAPTDFQQGDAYRIIYIHVPAAWMSMLIYVAMAFWAGLGLVLNTRLSSMMATALAPTGALMTFIALWTGALWGKPTWGTWWVWDARLTSELLLLFLYLGFMALQAAADDPRRADRAGALLLDTSSAEPWLTEQTAAALAARGATMVDAPVSGAAWGAADATLVFMVGGAAADVERVRPLLQRMGRSVFHLGALGCGHAMKCLNNCITAMTFAATSEALVAGKRYGLDPQAMVDVLNESTGGSWITQTHYQQRVFNRAFDDPFKLGLMLKDVGIALQLARQTATPMPMAGLGQQLWRMADHAAGPGASVSELVRWVERLSGTELTPGAGPRQG